VTVPLSSTTLDPFLSRTRIAYFSMEIALRPEIHTYSGGLGVLAGDTARSCADLELPVVFVTLVSRVGYLHQEIDVQGRQTDRPDPWDPAAWTTQLTAMIAVPIEGREVWVRPWLYLLNSPLGHSIPVLLLDTDLDENGADDRRITDRLYGGDNEYRLRQELILGIGGVRLLEALGFHIRAYHMNEGHAAFLAVQLLRQFRRPAEDVGPGEPIYDPARVRERCVFTTHTPVEAAQDRFPYEMVQRLLGDYIDIAELRMLGGADALNMTLLALNLSGYVNGVARRHAETTHRFFPGYRIHAITNGVHPQTWTHAAFQRLYQAEFPQWAYEPEVLSRADQLDDGAIWSAHQEAKRDLLALVKARCGLELTLDQPILGFARRMTGYKRPDLLFADIERLAMLARQYPFQLVFAGKAHPRDESGRRLIEELHQYARRLVNVVPMAFLPNYDMAIAATLVAGADLWLNTPLPPLEASGTSGMKAAFNGVLNLSVLDGWWIEACIEGVTGWSIGDGDLGAPVCHAEALYRKLETIVLPLYARDRARWIWMMKQSISKIGAFFNSQRMMRRYATEAYLR
jgi:glycogen phosphorylase